MRTIRWRCRRPGKGHDHSSPSVQLRSTTPWHRTTSFTIRVSCSQKTIKLFDAGTRALGTNRPSPPRNAQASATSWERGYSFFPTAAGPPAGKRIAVLSDRPPHRSRVGSRVDGFQRVEQPLIAYLAMGLRTVPSHRAQMYVSASRRSRIASTSSVRSPWTRSMARSPSNCG